MAPLFTFDVDTAPLEAAFDTLARSLQVRLNDVSGDTAQRIVREARARLRRQLGPNATGQTERGITAVPAYDGRGWVILSDNDQLPNLPLWLDKGTRAGKRHNYARTAARPFFYISIELEASGHERRVIDAMQDEAESSGLGG